MDDATRAKLRVEANASLQRILDRIAADKKSTAEERRWLTLQALAIVGFLAPMLLSNPAVLPAVGTAKLGCSVLLFAVIVLFLWNIVEPRYVAEIERSVHREARASYEWDVRRGENTIDATDADQFAHLKAYAETSNAAHHHLAVNTIFRAWAHACIVIGLILLTWVLWRSNPPQAVATPHNLPSTNSTDPGVLRN